MTDPVVIRASSFSTLMDCAYCWQAEQLEGKSRPAGVPAGIGSAVHYSTAAFDRSRMGGESLTADDTAGLAVDYLHDYRGEIDWSDGISPHKAKGTAIRCHGSYCREISPGFQWVAVEETMEPIVIRMENGVLIKLTGTLDRIWSVGDQAGIADVKTGARVVGVDGAVVVSNHAAQCGTYELLGDTWLKNNRPDLTMSQAPKILGIQTTNNPRTGVGEIHRARRLLLGTDEQPGLLSYAAEFIKSGLFPPNPGSWRCSERYCSNFHDCPYHQ